MRLLVGGPPGLPTGRPQRGPGYPPGCVNPTSSGSLHPLDPHGFFAFLSEPITHARGGLARKSRIEDGRHVLTDLRHRLCLVSLGACISLSCTERALNNELEALCEDHCAVRFECGYSDDLRTVDECVSECVPSARQQRSECAADFELMRCQSLLSCDDIEAYSVGIHQYAKTAIFPPDYPCRDEHMEYMMSCFPD